MGVICDPKCAIASEGDRDNGGPFHEVTLVIAMWPDVGSFISVLVLFLVGVPGRSVPVDENSIQMRVDCLPNPSSNSA